MKPPAAARDEVGGLCVGYAVVRGGDYGFPGWFGHEQEGVEAG